MLFPLHLFLCTTKAVLLNDVLRVLSPKNPKNGISNLYKTMDDNLCVITVHMVRCSEKMERVLAFSEILEKAV